MAELGFSLLPDLTWPGLHYSAGLPNLHNTYSLDDAFALNDSYGYGDSSNYNYSRYPLFWDQCEQIGSDQFDCFSSCNQTAFASLHKLRNCASTALLASDSTSNLWYKVSNPRRIPVVNDGGNMNVSHVIISDPDVTANTTAKFIWECLRSKCDDLPDCKAGVDFWPDEMSLARIDGGTPYLLRAYGYRLINDMCSSLNLQLDGDIGGIGVYVSYWIHTSLVLLAFIVSVPLKILSFYASRRSKRCLKTSQLSDFTMRHLARLNSAMVEFHKAQCFFTIAINIAAIKVMIRGGLDPNSLEQIYNNYVFLKLIAISGFLPVTFTLFTLYIINDTFWYLIVLSGASIVFAIATLGALGSFSPTKSDIKALEDFYGKGDSPPCGGKQPWAYCYTDTYAYGITNQGSETAWKMLGFCLVVMCCLVASKLKLRHRSAVQRALAWLRKQASLIVSGRKPSNIAERVSQSTGLRIREPTRFSILTGINSTAAFFKNANTHIHQQEAAGPATFYYHALKLCVYLSFIGVYLWFFKLYISNLKVFATKKAYNNTWTFGQVVALTLWAPPLCEYVHVEMRGIKRASDHKLIAPYEVVKKDDSLEHDAVQLLHNPESARAEHISAGQNFPAAMSSDGTGTSLLRAEPSEPQSSSSKRARFLRVLSG